jgi:hypothetical protein
VMSVAVIYWVLDHGFYQSTSPVKQIMMVIGLIAAIFSIINAFVNIKLTRHLRLFLSIWSSVIMILFSVDNIVCVWQSGQVEEYTLLTDKILLGLQYFLLGVCSMYIVQNAMLILEFFPDKGRFFNQQYFKDIKALQKEHVSRYSNRQSPSSHSSIYLCFSGIFFTLNYFIEFLPRNTAIWIVFFLLNFLSYFLILRTEKNKHLQIKA